MYTLEKTHLTGSDVMQVRAALNLLRSDFAAVLGVHRATVVRWESRGREPLALKGLPADLLSALHDVIVVRRHPLDLVRETGRSVQQALLRGGRLAALRDLTYLATMTRMGWLFAR
jgi:DNA-binding XRE family transcriptional regulator